MSQCQAAAFLGIDFGTSGARAIAIDDAGEVLAEVKRGYGADAQTDRACAWERTSATHGASSPCTPSCRTCPPSTRSAIASIAFDGTSATAMLVQRSTGRSLAPAKLYNESQGEQAVQRVKSIAPASHTTTASTSSLCKLMTWHDAGVWQQHAADFLQQQQQQRGQQQGRPGEGTATSQQPPQTSALEHTPTSQATLGCPVVLCHQADWLAALCCGSYGYSDWNNALKLGYDPGTQQFPSWLTAQPFSALLPHTVLQPGSPIACITPALAAATGLPATALVCAGTTDSIAAFIAAGVTLPGAAVTSLGSSMAVKMLSRVRVDDAACGVYSHRLGGQLWLVGGASNTGGAVLRQHFTDAELSDLSGRMDVQLPTGLDYYPLPATGERFPVNDPCLAPRLTPRPDDDALFLQGMFEGMAAIEAEAYALLQRMGAPRVVQVLTAGGGAENGKWNAIRARVLGVEVLPAPNGEAAYGAALLARQGWQKQQNQPQQEVL
ncbi:MAG: hypothetical protein WDW36_009678 [Sanguina aurantia]